MISFRPVAAPKTVGIVGGGFTGSVFALKLAAACPTWSIHLIEPRERPGGGQAYGACGPEHVLNVPVNRMEPGLTPRFEDWLRPRSASLSGALAESGGSLADAFVPRRLLGDYIEERIAEVISSRKVRLHHLRAEAVSIRAAPRRIVLADESTLPVDMVVLASGNMPSRLPVAAGWKAKIVHDPWAPAALESIPRDAAVLLIGSGLTMVDVALSLFTRGHAGKIVAVSRHGLLPARHRSGQVWPPFLDRTMSPLQAMRIIRAQIRAAEQKSIPWQRVFDAARPSAPTIWSNWTLGQRSQFLRHLRTLWDVHRHRMPERIAIVIDEALRDGRLTVHAGRILALNDDRDGVTAAIKQRRGGLMTIEADAVVNCTGPQPDPCKAEHSLFADMSRQGLIRLDPLGQGVDSEDCKVADRWGAGSRWLFALGLLTRPAWWEITAVPEITAQIDRLVRKLASEEGLGLSGSLADAFLDIGAGI